MVDNLTDGLDESEDVLDTPGDGDDNNNINAQITMTKTIPKINKNTTITKMYGNPIHVTW